MYRFNWQHRPEIIKCMYFFQT